MSLLKRVNKPKKEVSQANLAELALRSIRDGVIITDKDGVIKFINPAAATMTGYGSKAIDLDYGLVVKLESKEGRELLPAEDQLAAAMKSGQPLESFQATLIVAASNDRIPVSISLTVSDDASKERIITLRDIAKELAEEGEQTEFISTASHEMRTPVATIDGYLSLCLNPQTATIDARANNYLTAAQAASKHLGKLFQDLLDVTKLDDNRIRPNMQPVEMVNFVEQITNDYQSQAKGLKINLSFGSDSPAAFGENRLKQVAYGFIDVDFLREILGNLIDNALKYTPEGGSVYVNVRGDGDRILINVTDTGIGISPEDIGHIFQKFYRADNSDTRTIGGTGLGLYLVKQRVEAMGGKVWAESAFGEGSTFYVSLPRLTDDEYEKRMIAVRSVQMNNPAQPAASAPAAQPAAPVPTVQPVAPAPVSRSTVQPTIQPRPTVQAPVATQAQPVAQPRPVASPQPQPQPVIQPQPAIRPQPAVQPQRVASLQPVTPAISPPTTPPVPGAPQIPPAPPVAPAPQAIQPVQPVQHQTNINQNGGEK